MFPATFAANTSSFVKTSNRIKSLRRMGYPLIFEISSEVSVFQVPGSPHVISRVPDPNSVLTNSAKGSLNCTPLTIRFRQSIIKPFRQEKLFVSLLVGIHTQLHRRLARTITNWILGFVFDW